MCMWVHLHVHVAYFPQRLSPELCSLVYTYTIHIHIHIHIHMHVHSPELCSLVRPIARLTD